MTGAAIMVANGQEAAFAQGYANPDEAVTVYSRVDGAPAVIWSYEVAGNQESLCNRTAKYSYVQ